MLLIKTKLNGVYFRESLIKKYNGKPDKCYYIKYYYLKQQKQECIGWLSEGITAKYAAQVRSEKLQSFKQPLANNNYIFQDLFDNFISWAKENKKGWAQDTAIYNNNIKYYLGNLNITDITHQDINSLLIKIKNRGKLNGKGAYKPMSIKHMLVLIKRIFNYNIQAGVINITNPANTVKLERFDNTRLAYLYNDEIERMFTYLNTGAEWYNDAALIKFAFFTGLRRGEIFNLVWNNVDLKNKRIFLYDTKGGKNESILLTDNAVDILNSLKDYNTDSFYVFPSKKGGKRNEVKTLWKRVKRKANIRFEIRFHDIRHTFGTLATSTIPVKIVQKMMTHKNINTTLRYAHTQDRELMQAATDLNNIFNNINK